MLPLNLEHGATLVAHARREAEAEVRGTRPVRAARPPEGLDAPRGAFVTLTRDADLRGCVGEPEPGGSLWGAVARSARKAARDPRFPPVRPRELPALQVEVSVLTLAVPLRVATMEALPDALRVGEHGLVLRAGRRRALLLPQVALEHGFTADQFLGACCAKAGLDPGAWRRDPALEWSVFGAQVFRESAPGGAVEEPGRGPRPDVV